MPKSSIQIYPAEARTDIQAVRDLLYDYGAARNFDKALGNYQGELDGLPGKYGPPGGHLLIARLDQEPAGCVAYQKLSPEICEMKRLYVDPKFRGNGIGKKLVEEILKAAKAHPYQIMRLDTHPSMTTAQKLYAQIGFYEIERYNQNPIPGIRFFEKKL